MNFTNAGINREQESVLAQIGGWLTEQGYYLAGGIALAIYYGHRQSVDLDWFTTAHIPDVLALAQRLRETGMPFETGHFAPGTLYGQIGNEPCKGCTMKDENVVVCSGHSRQSFVAPW